MLNRFLVTLSAVMLHLGVGSVYAWSVLVKPIMEHTGFTYSSVATVFSITILFLGLSAAFLGKTVRKYGPRISCTVSLALFALGSVLSGIAIDCANEYLLYLSYGVIVGIATGIAYLVPIPILMTWYPQHKGFATGIVVMGFGLSSTFAAMVYYLIIEHYSVVYSIIGMGLISCLLMAPSIAWLKPMVAEDEPTEEKTPVVERSEAVCNSNFLLLWLVFFVNIFVGISILSALSPMITDTFVDITVYDAAQFVGFIAIINGISRCIWSSISDLIGRPLTFGVMLILELASLICMIYYFDYFVFKACIVVLMSCYGGMFATMPGYLADLFGVEKLSDTLGVMLSAWGVAGLIGPKFLAIIYEHTGLYSDFFFVSTFMMILSNFLNFVLVERNLKILGGKLN